MNILGISAYYHDSAACLIVDGVIKAAAQEERFTRKKQDSSLPVNAVEYCLKSEGISLDEVDYLAFYDKPFLKFERLLQTYVAYAPLGFKSFIKSIPLWIKQKIWTKEIIKRDLNFKGEILFPEHHHSHGASAFFPCPYEEAVVLTLDGVGEWATTSLGVGKGNDYNILSEIHFPHSLGLLYSAFTYYTGFKVNSGEYKVMGLAPYGEPKYVQTILDNLIDIKEDGSFKLNMKYFDYCTGLTMTNKHFDKLFGGPPRKPETQMVQKEMDLARSVQDVTEMVMLKMVRHAVKKTGIKNLCLAGGVALNCVWNGKILKDAAIENLWIQPAAGDAGGAVGAALTVWHQYLGKERVINPSGDLQSGSYLGPSYSTDEIKTWLNQKEIPYEELTDDSMPPKVADLIAGQNVIGWFVGRMEFGPRALGARSIIADARSPKMQEIMNIKIKFRESFRPFAPAVLKENLGDYFDMDYESPYMLLVAPVKESIRRDMTDDEKNLFGIEKLNVRRSQLPAITHVDYSARIQTVSEETNPKFYKTIKSLKAKEDCSVVINTSFNVRGEPIVCTPEEAYLCFMRTHMDYLVLENCLLDKKKQKALDNDTDWQNEFELD